MCLVGFMSNLAGVERALPLPDGEAPALLAPTMRRDGDDFLFSWPQHRVAIGVTRLHETATTVTGEITITQEILGSIHWGSLHLTSTRAREDLTTKLRKHFEGPPWQVMIEKVCRVTVEQYRQGAPTRLLEPAAPRPVRDLMEKLLPVSETTVLTGDGGAGKSTFALAVGLALVTGTALPHGLRPTQRANVLYLDYESNEDEHAERLYGLTRGLGIEYAGGIYYRAMTRPLADEAPALRAEISRLDIGFVICDSLAPACGPEPETADAVIRTMNALRSFAPATRLVPAHVTKLVAGQKTPARPFGSVFVRNLARSEWELRAAEEEHDDGALTTGLYHRKVNRGRKHLPMSLRFEFDGDVIRLCADDLADHDDLLERTSMAYRLHQELKGGRASSADLAQRLGLSGKEESVKRTLRRWKKSGKVVDFEEGKAKLWGLKA